MRRAAVGIVPLDAPTGTHLHQSQAAKRCLPPRRSYGVFSLPGLLGKDGDDGGQVGGASNRTVTSVKPRDRSMLSSMARVLSSARRTMSPSCAAA